MVIGTSRTGLSTSSYSELDKNQFELQRNPFTENNENPGDRLEDPGDPSNELEGIQGFDRQLLDHFKSGFQPLLVRNPTATIYTVPKRIYKLKPKIYHNRYQYFGIVMNFNNFYPSKNLKDLHMLAHMNSILSRNVNNTFEHYLLAMKQMRERIRQCHLVKIRVDFKCLIALVLSCCHILDVILLFFEDKLTPQVDETCSTALRELRTDMLLVQSQIPFFALQKIYDMLHLDHSVYPSLTHLSLHFFKEYFQFNQQVDPMPSDKIHHLLHLIHYHLLPPNYFLKQQGSKSLFLSHCLELPISVPSPSKQPRTIYPIPCARRLRDAGIKLKKKKTAGFSNITFHRGVLKIPCLLLDNYTEVLLRNLIAWEQCHPNVGAYFTGYGIFMDFIINTAEDVDILSRHRILEQTLGSEEEVASVFNGLSTNIFYSQQENDLLPSVCEEINKYCENKFNIWKANLINDYFGNPWAIISVVAAIVLLFLTATQTFFAAFAYFRPP
ncbi:UPF0481 protein At3g47200-like [Aristolochia californica]|uniref:UPF0481 protein At3g47200-like n=1 Tax=Aristolochia californica TaxID=171875 RepID=UPI0035E33AE6